MALYGLQDSGQINKALFLQANWHIKIERENQEGLLWRASKELVKLNEEQA
jgi:hypothetical protein